MFFCGFFLAAYLSVGQVSQGGSPILFMESKSTKAPIVKMPEVDDKMLLEQAIDEYSGSNNLKPFRFAAPFSVNYTASNSGTWLTAGDGTQVWRLTIVSENAKSLNLVFNNFKLPAGARLFLYNENRKHIIGAFTSYNNKSSGKFAVMPVPGDKVTVQYEIPAGFAREDDFVIAQVNHDFAGILKSNDRRPCFPNIAGSCNIDVNCEIGEGWSDVRDAVCRLIINGTNGSELCSGTLINNTAGDQTPYVLSAAHCYSRWEYAETTIYCFNYESPYCAPLDGDPSNSVSGAIMKARYDSLDFALAEMSLVPPPEYRPCFAGWDKSGDMSDTVVSIHHPWGDIKKISFDYDRPVFDGYGSKYISNAFIKIARWDEGVTEAGSSGGGLFNMDEKLIGTLTGGYATCSSPVRDYYARFDIAWDYNPDPTKQLKHWLDPGNTGTEYMDGERFYTDENLCGAFTNLTGKDEHQLFAMTEDTAFAGYWGGTNDAGLTEFVEKFSLEGEEVLRGISLGAGRVYDSGADGTITVKVYDGTALPENLIYSQNVDLAFFVEDAMNYIGFEEDVQPADTFFIGFALNGLGTADTFAVYQSLRDAGEDNFFYYQKGGVWYDFTETNPDNYSVSNVIQVLACNIDKVIDCVPQGQGIDNPQAITIYPNPANSLFILEAGTKNPEKNITVFNLLGQQVEADIISNGGGKTQIDLSGNVPGVYFVRLNNGNNFVVQKVSYIPY